MDFLEIITIFELASTSSKRVTLVPIFFRKNQSPAPLFLLFRKNPGCAPKEKNFRSFLARFFPFRLPTTFSRSCACGAICCENESSNSIDYFSHRIHGFSRKITIFEIASTSSKWVTLVPIFFWKKSVTRSTVPPLPQKTPAALPKKKLSLLSRSVFSFSLAYHFFSVTAAPFIAKD